MEKDQEEIMSEVQNEPSEKVKEMAQALSRFVNTTSYRENDALAAEILRDHPTLQQSVIRLFLKTIELMAEKPRVDGRNEASKQVCQMVVEGFKKERAKFDSELHGREINDAANPSQYLPYI
jgi:hypothetical protein